MPFPKQEARILRQAAALICPFTFVTGRQRSDIDPQAFDPDSQQVSELLHPQRIHPYEHLYYGSGFVISGSAP